MKKVIPIMTSGLLSAGLALGVFMYLQEPQQVTEIRTVQTEPTVQFHNTANVPLNTPSFEQAAKRSLNGVVHIKTVAIKEGGVAVDPFRGFFGGDPYYKLPDQKLGGSGSGVIISDKGYIATNNHVVNGATEIEVTLNDKRSFKGTVIGTDPNTDLALIKIDAKNLKPISYGNSDKVNVGEWVLAVGNPFNLTSTVTAGIVSAKGRNINILKEQYAVESFIQTDAAVNPGNSGGALVNTKGELVGINTAIASNTGSYTGYSFAVPVNMVKKIMTDLLKYGTVQRALLGVSIRDVDQKLAKEKSLKSLKGVYINKVFESTAASEGGLKSGDVITKVGSANVGSSAELQEQVSQLNPGDKTTITYIRDGKEHTANLTLRNKNGTTEAIAKETEFLGAKFGNVSPQDKKKMGITHGVKIENLKVGKFLREGIQKGFIITKIDKKKINSEQDVIDALKNKKGGVLIEGVYPNGSKAYYGFGM